MAIGWPALFDIVNIGSKSRCRKNRCDLRRESFQINDLMRNMSRLCRADVASMSRNRRMDVAQMSR
jgi:hypothetical protein